MTRAAILGSALERLVHQLAHGVADDSMTDELAGWLAGSARFRAFAEARKDKIRKKLRGAADAEARRDVRAELLAARVLLGDRRIDLAWEAYGSGKSGPDFTVTFRGQPGFNLEVTRLRGTPDVVRLGGSILAKLRQLPPSAPNVVLAAIEGGSSEELDIAAAARALRARADARDEAFFARGGFAGTREFYERYLRLGAVLVWCEAAAGDGRATQWRNPSARIAVPERAAQAIVQLLRAGTDE